MSLTLFDERPDPNADLVGREVTVEGVQYAVTGTPTWSDQYVWVASENGDRTVVVVAYLRGASCR